MNFFQDDPFPVDPGQAAYERLRQTAETARIDAELDLVETERIALEQIAIDVEQWPAVDDLPAFVRGERIA